MVYVIFCRYEYLSSDGKKFTEFFKTDNTFDSEDKVKERIKELKTLSSSTDKHTKLKHEFKYEYVDETLFPQPKMRRPKGRPKKFTNDELNDYIEKTYGYNLHKTYAYWHPIYHWESSCQGTVPQAIIAFLDSTDFEDAIRKAVSLGGDSDTLACITGGIAEAYYKEIPKHMAERTMRIFPQIFNDVLEGIRKDTVYGETCRIIG